MTHTDRVAGQRKVVLEELKKNSSDIIFDLLADILSIEREYREHKYGVREAIRDAIDRTAKYDLPEEE